MGHDSTHKQRMDTGMKNEQARQDKLNQLEIEATKIEIQIEVLRAKLKDIDRMYDLVKNEDTDMDKLMELVKEYEQLNDAVEHNEYLTGQQLNWHEQRIGIILHDMWMNHGYTPIREVE